MRSPASRRSLVLLTVLLSVVACGGEVDEVIDDETPLPEGDFWQAGDADEPPEPGKADAVLGSRTLPTSDDASDSAVWSVTRQWAAKVDVDFPPYFRRSDNLTWNQAYARFIEGMEAIPSLDGRKTYKVRNPWGKTLPIAALECAEQSIFLRVTFAAWFKLPYFMEAIDGAGTRVFAGHFGFRTRTGLYKNFPLFKTRYRDYSATATATNWPKDTSLRALKLGGDDDQSGVLGLAKATYGTYADELHANKRVGYFVRLLLLYFGSVNLADPANTFHVKADALRAGDILLERWQRAGIGHTLNLKRVTKLSSGLFEAELASGSMPRRQAIWESATMSRRYFLAEIAGGTGSNWDGIPYARLGGGLRRWRVPVVHNGSWVNVVPAESSAAWINSTDLAAIGARPARFEQILAQTDPTVRRGELVRALASVRSHLHDKPAACTSRETRESLIEELIQLEADDNGMSRDDAELLYRRYEDYLAPPMVYDRSRVCCFNTSTPAMADLAVAYNREQERRTQQCRPPLPFIADNLATFKAYAVSVGRGTEWRDWRADEPCPQSTLVADTLAPNQMAPYCSVRGQLPP